MVSERSSRGEASPCTRGLTTKRSVAKDSLAPVFIRPARGVVSIMQRASFDPRGSADEKILPGMMKAAYLNGSYTIDSLVIGELAIPAPRAGEVLVRVYATALTPTELQWIPTFRARSGGPRPFPIVLGHEFSGVIAAVGSGVTDVADGEAVYGLNDWHANGAQAEYCVTPASAIALKPRSLDFVQAAATPISALTAWQALIVRSQLRRGETTLIHGAAGAVGLFAVQVAHLCGARVIATASAANAELVRSLGADEVIDYQKIRFDEVVREVDVIFDPIGGETLERSWAVLRSGGRLVTIAAGSEQLTEPRVRDAFLLVAPDRAELTAIGTAIDAGRLRVFVDAEYPLFRAREAYASAMRGGGRGKTVLRVSAEPGEPATR